MLCSKKILDDVMWWEDTGRCYVVRRYWTMLCGEKILDDVMWWEDTGRCYVVRRYWTMLCGEKILDDVMWWEDTGRCYVVRRYWTMLCGEKILEDYTWLETGPKKGLSLFGCVLFVTGFSCVLVWVYEASTRWNQAWIHAKAANVIRQTSTEVCR